MSFSAVLRYFLKTPRRMARNLSRSPDPKHPQWVVRRPRLLPTRGLIQLAPVSTHHRTTDGRQAHTKSRRRPSRDKLKLSSEGKVQQGRAGQGRAHGFQTVSTAHRLLTLASAVVAFLSSRASLLAFHSPVLASSGEKVCFKRRGGRIFPSPDSILSPCALNRIGQWTLVPSVDTR